LGQVLSEDARIVRAVESSAKQAGFRGDAFYLIRRERPDWTRERWDAATLELAGMPRAGQSTGPVTAGSTLTSLLGLMSR
jgi:hypothetical protein